ncbi:unnamed protein product [Mycetohabitans rhizoxinica HKI 454]|uniref:Transposase n=1 Tax=Mycetohabitans rhizoxinica (strain DSM 19002 / CIP 109453 / HKI 454) TaxID=882378 RepID=E5AKL3_MYCRK|nr:unnamed protein product [Mycetohabitans rhizoxinica HKI 454]
MLAFLRGWLTQTIRFRALIRADFRSRRRRDPQRTQAFLSRLGLSAWGLLGANVTVPRYA